MAAPAETSSEFPSRRTREAIKIALAMTIAYGVALALDWDNPKWAALAVAMCSLNTLGETLGRLGMRLVGTLLAIVVAFILIGLFPQDRWLFILSVSLWIGLCTYMMSGDRHQYSWKVAGFVCVIIALDAGPDPANAFRIATLRAQETGLGVLACSLVAALIWPSRGPSSPSVPRRSAPAALTIDPDRAGFAVRIMVIMWLAFLAVIYVPDLPAATGTLLMSCVIGMTCATMPSLPLRKMLGPFAVATAVPGFIHVFVMPHLTTYAGLGTVVFAYTFAVCYLFAKPEQALAKLVALGYFGPIVMISNQQTYSFLGVADFAVSLAVLLLILAVTSYAPISWHPETVFLRLVRRVFRSSEALLSEAGRPPTRLQRWRTGFHLRELSTLPAKLESWKPHVDLRTPSGAPADVPAMIASLKDLADGVRACVEARPAAGADAGDVRAWQLAVRQALQQLSEDPAAAGPEDVRAPWIDTMGRVEAQRDRTRVTQAMLAYAGSAGALDWNRWREEAY